VYRGRASFPLSPLRKFQSRSDAVLATQGEASLRAEPWVGSASKFHSPEKTGYIPLSGAKIFFVIQTQGSTSFYPGLRVLRGSATWECFPSKRIVPSPDCRAGSTGLRDLKNPRTTMLLTHRCWLLGFKGVKSASLTHIAQVCSGSSHPGRTHGSRFSRVRTYNGV
jgi:hypothetical protein